MGSAEARWGWRVVDGDGVGAVWRRSWDRLTRRWCYPLLRWVLGYGYPAYGCGRLMANIMRGLLSALSVRRLPLSSGLLWIRRAAIRIVDPNGLSRCSRNDIKKTAFGRSLLF